MLGRPSSGLPIDSNVFRPMITGLPMVAAMKNCMSFGNRQGRLLPWPITRFSAMAQISEILKDATTVHHGHMPEIEIVDADNATGVWAMEDLVQLPGIALQGWGHYHERYRREAGSWKIASIRLSRLRLVQNGEEVAL